MMNFRRIPLLILLIVICLTCTFFTVYLTVFNHKPPTEIIAANRKSHRHKSINEFVNVPDKESQTVKTAKRWRKFIDDHNYVEIGDVFDDCDKKDHITIGKVILLQDEETGGLKARTFVNITLKKELTIGEFFVDSKYNGQQLYDNHWEFCTIDEKQKKRQVFCPYKPGFHSWATDKKIPTFLPKGSYETKAWLNDDDGDVLTCGYSLFVL